MNNLKTYFVETHEYNFETGNCDLLEYFAYEFELVKSLDWIYYPVHPTVLSIALF